MPRHEGFWSSAPSFIEGVMVDPGQAWLPFPKPQAQPWVGEAAFLTALDEVEAALKEQGRCVSYRGFSICRLCQEQHLNGTREFQHPNWVWPEGFRHYVAGHHVRPRKAFEAWVLSRVALTPDRRVFPKDHDFPPRLPRAPGELVTRLAEILRRRIGR